MTDLTLVLGLGLTVIGIILAVLVMISVTVRSRGVRGGGILLIGPIPIVFGTDQQSVKLLIVLAIILMLIISSLTIFSYLAK
ncbi:MAG TPA: DUF131 domain-containing protein [Candidatus Bathyarchaeia archaeon]|nr:DUF131 domain-containing protein [Candidatus Bathyarchaeia archaeon]